MADNNYEGTNVTLASDNIGETHYPRVKLSHGVDGTAVDASDSAPLPVGEDKGVFNAAAGTKVALAGVSATVITPPAGCKYIRIDSTANIFVRTDGAVAADAAGAIRILANVPEIIPVVAGTAVTAIGTATVYAVPYATR